MDRVLPVAVIAAVVLLLYLGFALGWRARRRSQSRLPALDSPPDVLGEAVAVVDGFYVATTHAERPTDRIAVRGLGFRARAGVAVHPDGVVLSIAGQPNAFIPVAAIVGIGLATWTIDRVVGTGGLVFIRWRLGDAVVDTNVRVAEPSALVAALQTIVPAAEEAA